MTNQNHRIQYGSSIFERYFFHPLLCRFLFLHDNVQIKAKKKDEPKQTQTQVQREYIGYQ